MSLFLDFPWYYFLKSINKQVNNKTKQKLPKTNQNMNILPKAVTKIKNVFFILAFYISTRFHSWIC